MLVSDGCRVVNVLAFRAISILVHGALFVNYIISKVVFTKYECKVIYRAVIMLIVCAVFLSCGRPFGYV